MTSEQYPNSLGTTGSNLGYHYDSMGRLMKLTVQVASQHWSAGVLLLLTLASNVQAQCERPLQRPGYSVCVPNGWRVLLEENPESKRTILCKENSGRCLKNKEPYPFPGVLRVDIQAIDALERYDWLTPDEVVERANAFGVPSFANVPLKPLGALGRTCWVVRVLEFGDLWSEYYALTIDGNRFVIRAFYNNEAQNVSRFRSAVIDIITSIAPKT